LIIHNKINVPVHISHHNASEKLTLPSMGTEVTSLNGVCTQVGNLVTYLQSSSRNFYVFTLGERILLARQTSFYISHIIPSVNTLLLLLQNYYLRKQANNIR